MQRIYTRVKRDGDFCFYIQHVNEYMLSLSVSSFHIYAIIIYTCGEVAQS